MRLWRKTVVYACPSPSENVSVSYGQCALYTSLTSCRCTHTHLCSSFLCYILLEIWTCWLYLVCNTNVGALHGKGNCSYAHTCKYLIVRKCCYVLKCVWIKKFTGNYILPLQIWLMGKHKTHQWIKKTNQSVFYLSWLNWQNYSLEIQKIRKHHLLDFWLDWIDLRMWQHIKVSSLTQSEFCWENDLFMKKIKIKIEFPTASQFPS